MKISILENIVCAIIMLVVAGGCSTGGDETHRLVAETLEQAGDNAAELQAVLERYADGRRDLAEYAVAAAWSRRARTGPGMDSIEALYRELPNKNGFIWQFDSAQLARGRHYESMRLSVTKDASVITAGYMAENIDDAWRLWKKRQWNRGLPLNLMCETLLPYRIGDEPLTRWREPYRNWLAGLEDSLALCTNSVDAARIIVQKIGASPYNDRLSTPHRSALDLLEAPIGYCREDCDRTLYAMRSMGVPVAVDRILVSPDNGTSHMWTVVWDNEDCRMRMFDNEKYFPTRDSVHYDRRRKGKVYRSTFAPSMERLARYRNAKNPPPMLLNPWLKDVTAEYFGHNRAEVEVWQDAIGRDDVYLGVFADRRFKPVDIAVVKGGKAVFTDIEPNLIYAPVTAAGKVCGYPFMLRSDGQVHNFLPDESCRESMTLTRKYPVRFHQQNRLESVVGVHVQSAPAASGPWTDLEVIAAPPVHSYRRISPRIQPTGRYLRLYKPDAVAPGAFRPEISVVLACRDTLGLDTMPISIVGDSEARERYARILLPGYGFGLDPQDEHCILHIDCSDEVKALYLVPANDDNYVVPAQEYELLYFAGRDGWKSAGRKVSAGFSVNFEAPPGAVLWLRNLTKGREEQIFVWHGGRQLFNIDLHDATLL